MPTATKIPQIPDPGTSTETERHVRRPYPTPAVEALAKKASTASLQVTAGDFIFAVVTGSLPDRKLRHWARLQSPEEQLRTRSAARELFAFKSMTTRQLDNLSHLPPNWNGYGAAPINPLTIESAKHLVLTLPSSIMSAPQVVPMTRGRLQLEWHCGSRHLELEFETPTTVHYLRWDDASGFEEEHIVSTLHPRYITEVIAWCVSGA